MEDENKLTDLIKSEEVYDEFKDSVERALDNLKQIESIKNANKYLASRIKDEFGVPTKFFNAVVKHAFKNEINEELEFLGEIEEILSQLKGDDDEFME